MMQRYAKIAVFVLVGIFLFSGLIKLNDPIGTQLKLEEYFDVFATDFPWMDGFWKFWIPYSIGLSIFLSSLEIILAITLWFNYKTKWTLWSLIILLVFFGFLTFYSAYFNKVTDCGCFGEAIKLTPWTSFGKDVFLILVTISLFFTQEKNLDKKTFKIVLTSGILSISLGIYTFFYLPIHDGLPYAIGENIQANMKPREALKFSYVYKINGKLTEVAEMPTDPKAEFVSMKALNEKEARPLITDYRIWVDNDTTDYTKQSFEGQRVLIIIPNIHHTHSQSLQEIRTLAKALETKKIPVWLISASSDDEVNQLRHTYQLAFPALSADTKILKTISRSSPGILTLDHGTVKGKWSAYDLPTLLEIEQSLTTAVQE